ncbi:hypothetical protein A6C57_05245 [Fibrella sp. ES10-3-2-2]|nr:hypothetical protein A6C57_05245 [Fibrella sp. ES10-3-2-2]
MIRFNLTFLCTLLLAISGINAQNTNQRSEARTPIFRVNFYVNGSLIDPKKGVPARAEDFRIDIESPDPAHEKVVLKKAVVTVASGARRIAFSPYYPNSKTSSGMGWNATAGDRVVIDLTELTIERPGEKPVALANRTNYTLPVY